MAEDKKDNEGWTEVEIDAPPVELKGEIEIEETLSEDPVVVQEPEIETKTEEAEAEKEPELEGIETKGAEKRIRQLIKQRKERDEELRKLHNEVSSMKSQLSEIGNLKFEYDDAVVQAKENEITQKLDSARTKFKSAYDNGNRDDVLESQEQIAEAQADLKLLNQQKDWIKQQSAQYKKDQELQTKQLQEERNTKTVDPLAREWAENNSWFGKDRTRTAVALSIDAELKENGEDPSDPAFYEKINQKLREELPSKFANEVSEEATPSKPRQVVAGRSHSPVSKNKVKLTSEDVRLAKKWSIPLERYAAEKAKAERSDGDYTTVV